MGNRVPSLTRRERDVLMALCKPVLAAEAFTEPSSVRDVADTLGVSEAAVKQHFAHLYDKFEIYEGEEHRRIKLANLVLSRGVLTRSDLGESVGSSDLESAASADAETETSVPSMAVAAGREAVRFRNWDKAYAEFSVADQTGSSLGAADLVALGDAALWSGRNQESIDARQRAHALYLQQGDLRSAAAVALALVINYVTHLKPAAASGWFAKAKRYLDGVAPCLELGYLALTEALFALAKGDAASGLDLANEAFTIAERHQDSDLRALGLTFQGYALCQLGRTAEATPFIDEAMASAVAGELGPLATGLVYCRTICASLESFDYRRALEWTEAIGRVAGDSCTGGFPGDCRAHHASILVFRGEWAEGEAEARLASIESERFDLGHSGLALYEVGQVRLRTGDLDGADRAFKQALDLGMNPQPGFALLQLARGDVDTAAASISNAVEECALGSLQRARLLPAQVDIALASNDCETARQAAEELARMVADWPGGALQAAAETALGISTLMDGDYPGAARHLRQGYRLWFEVDSPYEAARCRVLLAEALRSLGDTATAKLEMEAALSSFGRLGARLDAERAAAALATAST